MLFTTAPAPVLVAFVPGGFFLILRLLLLLLLRLWQESYFRRDGASDMFYPFEMSREQVDTHCWLKYGEATSCAKKGGGGWCWCWWRRAEAGGGRGGRGGGGGAGGGGEGGGGKWLSDEIICVQACRPRGPGSRNPTAASRACRLPRTLCSAMAGSTRGASGALRPTPPCRLCPRLSGWCGSLRARTIWICSLPTLQVMRTHKLAN